MNNYNDAERGKFQVEDYAKQLISFDGMKFEGQNGVRNVTPTDIDGMVELTNINAFIIFELKHSGNLPQGQKQALAKLCDKIEDGGAHAVVFVATHNTPCSQTIIAKDAIVQMIYWDHKWHQGKTPQKKLYDYANDYVKYIKEEKEREARSHN